MPQLLRYLISIVVFCSFLTNILGQNCLSSSVFDKLFVDDCIVSSNQQYSACLRPDGRLCVTSSYFPEWCTAGSSLHPDFMRVGTTGLTFYDRLGVIYHTIQSTDRYSSYNPHDLLMQDDGNLVLYLRGNTISGAVWACNWDSCIYHSSCSCYDALFYGCIYSCDPTCNAIIPPPSFRPTARPISPTFRPTVVSVSPQDDNTLVIIIVLSVALGALLILACCCLGYYYYKHHYYHKSSKIVVVAKYELT